MRAVNASLQTLSAIAQSGWKATQEVAMEKTRSANRSKVHSATKTARQSLDRLRDTCPGDLAVERAACSITGKLLALNMFDETLIFLNDMHPRLLCLAVPRQSVTGTPPSPLHLLSLPRPASGDTTVLTLLVTTITHALNALLFLLLRPSSPFSANAFVLALQNSHSLLAWAPNMNGDVIPEKTRDALLTRAYTAITKTCTVLSSNNEGIADPECIFRLRVYALSCLLYTTPGTIKSATFWDQVQSACLSYARASSTSSNSNDKEEESTIAACISSHLSELVGLVHELQVPAFPEGRSFVQMCEMWMSFAKEGGDMTILVHISDLMDVSSGSSSVNNLKISSDHAHVEGTESKAFQYTWDMALVECAQCCATFVKATVSLDSEDADVLRAHGKMERALERLRRAALRILDSQQPEKKDSRDSATCLLEVIVNTLENSLAQVKVPFHDILTSLLDVLFVLARTRLVCSDVDSYTPALQYLDRAVAAVNAASTSLIAPADAANLLRCISGALHNLGGTLYAAARLGGAVRFLKEGCAVGSRALVLHATTLMEERHPERDREMDGWKQLEEQLFRRFELLGICHSKIGDRKLAYESFIESVRTFPYTHYSSVISSDDPFASAAPLPLKQLSSIIERLTYTGTCELLLSSARVTLRHVFQTLTLPIDTRSRAEITGAVLSHQLTALESLTHKKPAREVVWHVLQDLLEIYDASWAPVRRVRVLVTALSISWKDGYASGGEQTWLDAERMGKEALELLARDVCVKTPGHLPILIPQLRIPAHLWLALHAYRRSPSGTEMTNAVAIHVEAVCGVLTSLLPRSESGAAGAGSPKAKRVSGTGPGTKVTKSSSGTVKKGKGRPAAAATTSGPKKAAAVNTVTPRHRKVLEAVSLNTGEVTPPRTRAGTKITAPTIDLRPVLGLIQMNVHLLGLLGLIVLKVKLLEILKRLCEHQVPTPMEAYSVICVDLAHEYIKLGKSKRAGSLFSKCANLLKAGEVPDEVRLRYLLGQAEVLALGDNFSASASLYCEAQSLEAVVAVEEKTMTTAQRIRTRVERLERAALACRVFAAVQYSKDNVVGAMYSMLQSLRLWNRAVDALSRLNLPNSSAPKLPKENSNPFDVSNEGSNNDQSLSSSPSRSGPSPSDALSWRLLSSLISTLFSLAQAYFSRGSPREALYFTQQALDLAETTRSPTMVARALIMRGEVLLGQGEVKEGRDALEGAARLLGSMSGMDAADAQRLKGDYGVLCEGLAERGDEEDPKESYARARRMLDELEGMIVSVGGGSVRRKSSLGTLPNGAIVDAGQGMVVPRLLSAILRRHIWLLRNDGDEVFKELVDRLMTLPPSVEIKGEEHAIMGKLTMHRVYELFRSDMFLSSLTESTIALPMGMSGGKDLSLVPATQDILSTLGDAEKLFWADLALTWRRGTAPHVREASISLARIRALQCSLGKASKEGPLLAARLLDASSAILLHREMLEVIQHKFPETHVDDLQWPQMTPDGSPLPVTASTRPTPRRRQHSSSSTSSTDTDENDASLTSLRSYWSALEKKYTSLTLSPSALSSSTPKLPVNWTVIHITLTPDKSTMFVSRLHTPFSQPLLFCLPLRGRRDTDEADEGSELTLDNALHELREVVRLSDEGTRRAAHVRNDDPQARAGWWAERAELDKRLQALLENIEFCWLGAFKTILSPPTTVSPEVINDLRTRLERVFKGNLPPRDKKRSRLHLDDALLACFSSLSPKCRDEELEDLVYFILDLYQFHGVPVAISEVDVDQVTVDLRTALAEHVAVRKKAKIAPVDDSHIFLVLDRTLQGIPWESIPALRDQSVSRIPSLEFLLDRLHLAEWQRKVTGHSDDREEKDTEAPIDRIHVDPRKAYYILNPSGDLKGTESRFASWLKEMHEVGWEGITGRAPSEQQFLNALSQNDLVIYFGHGGGEQYARSHKIRHLQRCAATMLWGCSSGALKEMGEFDRVGTPYNYMLAGCPTLVANLWDVTDRDIDKFTQSVFDHLHLTTNGVRRPRGGGDTRTGERSRSVVAAVAQSRQVCKLKYLTGAAPVVYGIPFYL
ncbi:peptidase family C50-domain-containing protein [Melanogaster broomeanus]|nr:peptidase family C50-domain-containing protein [Melanogaster broomeanus]